MGSWKIKNTQVGWDKKTTTMPKLFPNFFVQSSQHTINDDNLYTGLVIDSKLTFHVKQKEAVQQIYHDIGKHATTVLTNIKDRPNPRFVFLLVLLIWVLLCFMCWIFTLFLLFLSSTWQKIPKTIETFKLFIPTFADPFVLWLQRWEIFHYCQQFIHCKLSKNYHDPWLQVFYALDLENS